MHVNTSLPRMRKLTPSTPSLKSSVRAIVSLVLFALTASAAVADTYKRLQLDHRISIEVPSHWIRLSEVETENLNAAGLAALENSGVQPATGQKKTLLAMNAPPSPTGATIRLSVRSPPTYGQNDLAAATSSDLTELTSDFQKTIRTALKDTGIEVIKIQPIAVEMLKNRRALVMQYTRSQPNSSTRWEVTQYKIPTDRQLIELTLSYRQSEALLWKPILLKVKNSINF